MFDFLQTIGAFLIFLSSAIGFVGMLACAVIGARTVCRQYQAGKWVEDAIERVDVK